MKVLRNCGWAFCALACAGLFSACRDFQSAFDAYCAKSGNCDAGQGGGRDGGGADSGAVDAGTSDGGAADAGTSDGGGKDAGDTDAGGPCGDFGAACTGVGQCCSPTDGGRQYACSRLNRCQPPGPACLWDGYACRQNADCCNHECIGGRCHECGDVPPGNQSCSHAVDCCFQFGSDCSDVNVCNSQPASTLGWRCASADFCSTSYCKPVDAGGGPPDGLCANPSTCTPLNSAGLNCCPGTTQLTDGGTCCLPDKTDCNYSTSCCSGNCIGGHCTQAAGAGMGEECLGDAECGLNWCDAVSRTCEDRLCLPAGFPPQQSGCCLINQSNTYICDFLDGGACVMPSGACAVNTDCCSGICIAGTNRCRAVQYF